MYYKDEYPLHTASVRGDIDAMKVLHDKFGCDLNELNANGMSPILLAAIHNKSRVIAYLADNGVDINNPDSVSGTIPMEAAILNGSLEAMQELIRCGADIQFRGKGRKTALHLVCMSRCLNNVELLQWLHHSGLDLNDLDCGAQTPLHIAAHEGMMSVVESLVQLGANIDIRASNGTTPLYVAARKGHADIIRYLHKKGADINAVDNEGMSPCGVASLFGHLNAVKTIFDLGGNCHISDRNGFTPYDDAVAQGHVEIATLLNYILSANCQVCSFCRCRPAQKLIMICKLCKRHGYCSLECHRKGYAEHKQHCQNKNKTV